MTDLSKQRVVDPVLTELAQGYYNGNMISEVLFPVAETQKKAAKSRHSAVWRSVYKPLNANSAQNQTV